MLFLVACTSGSSARSVTSDNLVDLLLPNGCGISVCEGLLVEASAVETPEMLDCWEAVAEVVGLMRLDVLVIALDECVGFSADLPLLLFVA